MTLNQLGYFYQAAVLQHFNQAGRKNKHFRAKFKPFHHRFRK